MDARGVSVSPFGTANTIACILETEAGEAQSGHGATDTRTSYCGGRLALETLAESHLDRIEHRQHTVCDVVLLVIGHLRNQSFRAVVGF